MRVPRGWARQRIVLRFDAATHRATVRLDDTEVMSREGGYTPFEADVTALVSDLGVLQMGTQALADKFRTAAGKPIAAQY